MDYDKKYEFENYFSKRNLTDDKNEEDEEEPQDVDIQHPSNER